MQKELSAEKHYFLWSDSILKVNQLPQDQLNIQPSVYEVIRVDSGVPLFIDEHLERLKRSVELLNYTFKFSFSELKVAVGKLIEINERPQLNIKIIVNKLCSPNPNLFLFFIPSQYPTLEDYHEGVATITFKAERHNPNAKVVANQLREEINSSIRFYNAYEAILLNNKNEITEGSRSNIFLVKNEIVYTAPERDVLVGITRGRILNICKKLNIPVVEESIPVGFLKEIDGIFLTGTSPKVLPIASVNKSNIKSCNNNIITKIIKAYDDMIADYIFSYKI